MITNYPYLRVGAIAVAFAITGGARADVQTLVSARDGTLFMDPEGDIASGAGSAMFAGRNAAGSNSVRRAVVWFDIAAVVPAGATITGATLMLHNSAANDGVTPITLNRVVESWGEGTSTGGGPGGGNGGPAAPGDATWLFRSFPGTPWAAPGGAFAGTASASSPVGAAGFYSWSSAGLAADVQAALDSPLSNFGWIILGDETTGSTAKRFATREETLAERRPMLVIEYTAVPAPAGAGVLALAGMAAARRRR